MKTTKHDGGVLLAELIEVSEVTQRLRCDSNPEAAEWRLYGLELIEEISQPIPRPILDRLLGHVTLVPRTTFHGQLTYLQE